MNSYPRAEENSCCFLIPPIFKLTGYIALISKLGKEYVKAVYCHPAYLTYMQNIPYKMLGWNQRLLAEISTTVCSKDPHSQNE